EGAGRAGLRGAPARDALPALKEPGVRQTDDWLGFRPTFPDGLPVLGRSRASERVVYAFGHQHVGLTLGGLSGMVVADLLAGRKPPLDLTAVDPRRF
ncbi:FAD-dependent oxidoreductase, partial [Azospirillum brasilense]|nr:FAD-dependent oxidoreductase [Azospirillum brasilense]